MVSAKDVLFKIEHSRNQRFVLPCSIVNAARGNLFFGACGLFKNAEQCKIPANDEAASDTSADGHVWLPPSSVRGDIARAMFYMELRYDDDDGGLDLILTDCPTDADNEMAYLSQLLDWHLADPPDESERERNNRICERWQGNRNPFVDFEDLATSLFGSPQPILEGQFGYNCSTPMDNNTGIAPPGMCGGLNAGDVAVITVNSDNPDIVALVALSDLPAGTPLYMTDNAWTGTAFLSNEGILRVSRHLFSCRAVPVGCFSFVYRTCSLNLLVGYC